MFFTTKELFLLYLAESWAALFAIPAAVAISSSLPLELRGSSITVSELEKLSRWSAKLAVRSTSL